MSGFSRRNNLKSAIFLQARLGSSRLNQKIIKNLAGKTLIEQVTDRLKLSLGIIDELVIVTSHNSYDTLNSIFSDDDLVKVIAGSEDNVLERFYNANLQIQANIIIRATADNPFVSLDHLFSIMEHHISKNADLSHYLGLPWGAGVEVITSDALYKAYHQANTNYQFEHVTPYLYEHPEQFHIEEPQLNDIFNRPDIRITIDEEEDFQLAEILFNYFGNSENNFDLEQIIHVWDQKNLKTVNGSVSQKALI